MQILMPQLGESVTEGTIGKWLVTPGETVRKYQPIAEVITDKVNAEIPAPADGVITSLEVAEGSTHKVGTLIATMRAVGEEPAAAAAGAVAAGATGVAGAAVARRENAGRFSPAVLKLAQEHGLDLALVTGTGLGGRITRKDVEAYIASGGTRAESGAGAGGPLAARAGEAVQTGMAEVAGQTAAVAQTGPIQAVPGTEVHPASAPQRAPALQPSPAPRPLAGDQVVPVDAVRRRIAEKMLLSKHEAPHAWTMMPVDVTGLVKLKEQQGEDFKRREGISLSYVAFFIKAVVESLKEYPILNSQWAGDSIIIRQEINISIAVATETALAVPVIKQADRLSIAGLNYAVADLAARARAGRLTLDDISGGTFTVNNTGSFGSVMSAPIINHPQAAILAFEAITRTPAVLENDAIAIRSMMNLCLSLDHRILDGLVCGRFLQAVKRRLEAYGPGTVSLY